METINLRIKFTEAEYAAATNFYALRSSGFIFRFTICTVYTIACYFLMRWLEAAVEIQLLFLSVSFILPLIAFTFFFVVPRQRFRSDPKFADEYFLQFSDDGILLKTPHVESLLQWNLYREVLENEKFYLLIYGKHMYSAIPKRVFLNADQATRFDNLLRRKIPAHTNAKRLKAGQDAAQQDSYTPPPTPPDWR